MESSVRDESGARHAVTRIPGSEGPLTLSIDIGGTGLKASVLARDGSMTADRVRVPTAYPCTPQSLVSSLKALVAPLPSYDRVAVGFPGVVRAGRVLTAPHFVEESGPGSKVVPKLLEEWSGFDLEAALASELGAPVRAANDADVQGAAVVSGIGLELVVTLGTGVGTGLFMNGKLAPHLEIAHHPFRKGQTYNEQLGEATRHRIGIVKWNKRVQEAIENLYTLLMYDRVYIGGGNSRKVTVDLGPRVEIVDNSAGILGGIKLWEVGFL